MAVDLTTGAVGVNYFTPRQSLWLTGANWKYFWLARGLAANERLLVEAGCVSLCSIEEWRRHHPARLADVG
jgi:hypothetical protein